MINNEAIQGPNRSADASDRQYGSKGNTGDLESPFPLVGHHPANDTGGAMTRDRQASRDLPLTAGLVPFLSKPTTHAKPVSQVVW
jgi:hypothetical protein